MQHINLQQKRVVLCHLLHAVQSMSSLLPSRQLDYRDIDDGPLLPLG